MTPLPRDPAERHREVAAAFAALTRRVADWEAPSPVPAWSARDVVGHLVDWFPAFLAEGTAIHLPDGPPVEEDPVGAWAARAEALQSLLDDASAATTPFRHPRVPELPLATAVDRFYTADVFMHTWDLARAGGQEVTLDEELCAELLAGMEPIEEMMRASGQYGPRHPVPDGASVQDRLVAFIGRDPGWTPGEDTP